MSVADARDEVLVTSHEFAIGVGTHQDELRALDHLEAEVLRQAARWIIDTYGLTSRAAGLLMRQAAEIEKRHK